MPRCPLSAGAGRVCCDMRVPALRQSCADALGLFGAPTGDISRPFFVPSVAPTSDAFYSETFFTLKLSGDFCDSANPLIDSPDPPNTQAYSPGPSLSLSLSRKLVEGRRGSLRESASLLWYQTQSVAALGVRLVVPRGMSSLRMSYTLIAAIDSSSIQSRPPLAKLHGAQISPWPSLHAYSQ